MTICIGGHANNTIRQALSWKYQQINNVFFKIERGLEAWLRSSELLLHSLED